MALRLTQEEYIALKFRRETNPPDQVSKSNKHRSVIAECDGIKFSSKKEARYYQELRARQHIGEVKFFLMQVPFRLPGNAKHLLDFMEFWTDGSVHFVEVKGQDLPLGKLKRHQVEEIYGIRIVVV